MLEPITGKKMNKTIFNSHISFTYFTCIPPWGSPDGWNVGRFLHLQWYKLFCDYLGTWVEYSYTFLSTICNWQVSSLYCIFIGLPNVSCWILLSSPLAIECQRPLIQLPADTLIMCQSLTWSERKKNKHKKNKLVIW